MTSNIGNYNFTVPSDASPEVLQLATEAKELLKVQGEGELTADAKELIESRLDALANSGSLSAEDLQTISSMRQGLQSILTDQDESPEELAAVNRITIQSSTDEQSVEESLIVFAGMDNNASITPEQKTAFTSGLKVLAKEIATKNTTSPTSGDLTSWTPEVVLKELEGLLTPENTGLPTLVFDSMQEQVLTPLASSLASLNAASGEPAPVDPFFSLLNSSTDTDAIFEALLNNVDTSAFDQDTINNVITPQLQTLAAKIALQNENPETRGTGGIESANQETVESTMSALLGFEDDNSLSPEVKTTLRTALNKLAGNIAQTNEAKWTQDTLSTDKAVVEKALTALSNVNYDKTLTPEEKVATQDYLKVMSMALAFMSSIRAKIAELDASLQKSESQGKLGNIKDQTQIALRNYDTSMKKIHKQLEKLHKAGSNKLMMQILMPLIAALMMTVAIVLICLSWLTGGTSAVVAIMLISLTLTMTAATTAVASSNACEKMCDAMHIKDPAVRATVSMGVQLAIVILCTILSCGACAASIATTAATSATTTGVRMALQMALAALKEMMKQSIKSSALWMEIGGQTATTFFTSGIITQTAVKLLSACGLSDKDAQLAAMIITMILMMVMMLAMLGAGMGAAAGASKTAAREIPSAITGATKSLLSTRNVDEVATAGKTAAGVSKATQSTDSIAEVAGKEGELVLEESTSAIMQMLQRLAKNAEISAKSAKAKMLDPYFFIKLLTEIGLPASGVAAEVVSQSQTIAYNVQQADLTRIQIDLTKNISQGKALLDLLGQLLPGFEVNQQSLQEDADKSMESMKDLLNLFDNMVQQASKMTTNLAATAA